MTEYSDEELLEFSRTQAEETLTDEQMKRYNSLKAQKLHGDIEEHKGEVAGQNMEGLSQIVSDVQDDMVSTVNIAGNDIEILVDPDKQDFKTIKKLRQYQNLDDDKANEKAGEIKDNVLDLIGKFTINFSAEEWKDEFEENGVGLRATIHVAEKIVNEVEDELEQKKSR